MRTMTALVATLFAGALLAADDAKKDMAALDGEWTMVSGIANGKKLDDERVKSAKRVTKDGETTVHFGDDLYFKAKFTIDASKKPKTIDYKFTEGPNKDKTVLGIYEVDGDTVKFCFGQPDKERPKEFGSKEDSGHTLSVWKKAKK